MQWLVGATWLQFNQRQDIREQTQMPPGYLVPRQPVTVALPAGAMPPSRYRNERTVAPSHAQIDHAGGTGTLARELGLPIIGPHPGDQFWIDGR